MKVSVLLLLLAFLLRFDPAAGQTPQHASAGAGLRWPGDTVRVAAPLLFSLPSLSAFPGGRQSGPASRAPMPRAPEMPRAYSYRELGAFCKWEAQLEKAARMPVKFRLGEVQYVERLEGKLPDY